MTNQKLEEIAERQRTGQVSLGDTADLIAAVRTANIVNREKEFLSDLGLADKPQDPIKDIVFKSDVDDVRESHVVALQCLRNVLHLARPSHFVVINSDGVVIRDEIFYPTIYPQQIIEAVKPFVNLEEEQNK